MVNAIHCQQSRGDLFNAFLCRLLAVFTVGFAFLLHCEVVTTRKYCFCDLVGSRAVNLAEDHSTGFFMLFLVHHTLLHCLLFELIVLSLEVGIVQEFL
jgi:hypothetical protein